MNEFVQARLRYEKRQDRFQRRKPMEDTQLVATDPHQMAQAQHAMVEFCDAKLATLESEIVQAHGIIEALRKADPAPDLRHSHREGVAA
jgi:hypothetical protein